MPPTSLGRRFLTNDPGVIARFGDPFQPLEPECKVIQFSEMLTPAQLQRAGDLIEDRTDVQLYVYGRAARDLDFLRYFPALQRLHVALYELEDIAGLDFVPQLTQLNFGSTKKKFSLRFLERLPHLSDLFLVGHKHDLATIQQLTRLTAIALSGITLPDLSVLRPLRQLRKTAILLGGTRDLDALAELPELEDLFLMRITKLSDLGVLKDLRNLRKLRLDWMRNVTALPSLAGLGRLEEVELDTMKGLTDLSPIAAAPALRRLTIGDMRQLTLDSFGCLVGHPRLEELWAYTGKATVNTEVKRLLPGIAR